MAEFQWLLIWTAAGFPVLTVAHAIRLSRRARMDYAYFIESKEFPLTKVLIAKPVFAALFGLFLIISSVSGEIMVIGLGLFVILSSLLESTTVVEQPHPTPHYRRERQICESCSLNKDEHCTNLRMLDGFERKFTSADGRYRAICCCGLRISLFREISRL